MDTTEILLKQLKDIHLPPAPSIWPLAPGWYGLLAILIIGLAIFGLLKLKAYRANHYRRQALEELQKLNLNTINISQSVESINILLKRTALAAYPYEHVASLTGETWLAFLDRTASMQEFSHGIGRILSTAPYQKINQAPLEQLVIICRQWIKEHKDYL